MKKVLGVDLASGRWSDVGTAVVTFDEWTGRFTGVEVPGLCWPSHRGLTADALADALHEFAGLASLSAVALDGPQGWRSPDTSERTPGVGRRCEYLCRTQGKMGVYPRTYPATQRSFFEFCVDLFDALLAKPGVTLANDDDGATGTGGGYVLLECYPTSAWRSSGLKALPSKRRRPPLKPWFDALRETYALPQPRSDIASHDDLQALVAALCAAGTVGGPVVPLPAGVRASSPGGRGAAARRLEGFIWNVRSLRPVVPVDSPPR